MRRQRLELYELPDYVPRKNKSNDYGFDPHEQEHETYTGMGADINVHDQWACESMGTIQDRTREHLGQSDKAITAYRRLLRQAIERRQERRHAADGARSRSRRRTLTGPAAIDGIGPTDDWQGYWQKTDAEQAQGRELGEWACTRSSPAPRASAPSASVSRHRHRLRYADDPSLASERWSAPLSRGMTPSRRMPPRKSSSATLRRPPRSLERRAAPRRRRGRAGDQAAQARTGALCLLRSARRAARQDARRVGGRRARCAPASP